MSVDRIGELIEAADLNGLLRVIDDLCATRDWDGLIDLADRCEDAVDRGKQLWPIAAHVDYRLALEAPGDTAATVLESDLARFAPAPLTEVAGSSHTWKDIAPYLEVPRTAAYVAQERVIRGEDLTADERAHADVLSLPLVLQEWEPTYARASFKGSVMEISEPWEPLVPTRDLEVRPGEELDEPQLSSSLLDLVAPWTNESNGAARAVVVEGDAVAAASSLSGDILRMTELNDEEALQRIAWAASSGGAHGRRRGAAFGRFLTWYTIAALGDLEWPASAQALYGALRDLDFYLWDEGEPEEGWILRIAVADRANGWAAALAATDILSDDLEQD